MSGAARQVEITFDGAAEPTVIKLKPVGLMAVERKWGGDAFTDHPIEGMFYAAWVSIGMPGGDGGFDAWAGTIAELNTGDPDPLPDPATPSES